MTVSIMTVSISTVSIMAVSILTLSIMTVLIMTISILIVSISTVSISTVSIRHLGFAWPRSFAAPPLRGPAGLGASAPQLCGSGFRVNFQCCCFFPSYEFAPRLRSPHQGPEKRDPYNTFGPPGPEFATPTTLWGPRARKT